MATAKEKKIEEARATLKKFIKPSDTIAIVIKSVSNSGMSRRMRVYSKIMKDITYLVATLCELPNNDKGLLVQGCGMDMTFWLADHLTYSLYGYGKDLPKTLKGNGGKCLDWRVL